MKNTGKAKGIVDGMSMAIAFLIIVVIIIVVPLMFGGSDKKENSPESDKTPMFSESGYGYISKDKPGMAILDPRHSYVGAVNGGDLKFVLVSNESKYFVCDKRTNNMTKPELEEYLSPWWGMNKDRYRIYPYGKYENTKMLAEWYPYPKKN